MNSFLPRLFETIAKEAMSGIIVFASDGKCLFSNSMFIQLYGNGEPTLLDLSPTGPQAHFKPFSADLLKHDGFYQDILVRRQNSSTFIANVGVRFIEVDGHSAHLLMMQDVTLQKKLQREIIAKQTEINAAYEDLLKQNRSLKELDHAKDRFIALTTHELRTPLSAMVASAEILKLGLYDTPEQMKEFVDMIHDQGTQLQDLVNDILDFAKIRAGKMDFFIELHDVVGFTQAIARNFESMAEQDKIQMNFAAPPTAILCYYDEVRLRQVLSNVINNAIKYNRRGGSVNVEFLQDETVVKVLVKDTGKGIPSDQFEKVFNEFETLGQVAQHHKGTGLGMPISRKLIEGMGGTIELESSEIGVGSCFCVEIPKTKVLPAELYRPRNEFGVAV
jgi:signal transduction histidine kinase